MIFIGILFGIFFVYYLNDRNESKIDDFNKGLEFKLATIKPRPKLFHTDADLINFFHNIQDFKEYNEAAYADCIKSLDNMLRLHEDLKIGVIHCKHNYDTARNFADDAMNHFHSFIFSIPSTKFTSEKYQQNLARLQLLTRRHIDDMFQICREKQESEQINTETGFVTNKGPRPDDTGFFYNRRTYNPDYNHGFNVFY